MSNQITFAPPGSPIYWADPFVEAVKASKPLEEIREAARSFVEKIDKYFKEVTDSGQKVTSLYCYKVFFDTYPFEYNEVFEEALTEKFGVKFENVYSAAEFVMDVGSDVASDEE